MPKGYNADGTKGGFKKGYKQSKEHTEKIRLASLGRKHSTKTKEIISKKAKQRLKNPTKNPMYGVHRFGKENPNWRGGKTICNIRGRKYILIFSPDHPYKFRDRYVYEHRLIMEKHLGRYLKPKEIVHHIDNNPINNSIDNLMLFPSHSAHRNYHAKH